MSNDQHPPPAGMTTAVVPYETPEQRQAARDAARRRMEETEFEGDLDTWEKMEKAFELHRAGIGYRRIGEQLGMPTMTAYRAVARYIRVSVSQAMDVHAYTGEHLAEIRLTRKRIIAEALAVPRGERPWHFAAPILLKLQEREDKLTGRKDAPGPDEFAAMTEEELARYAA